MDSRSIRIVGGVLVLVVLGLVAFLKFGASPPIEEEFTIQDAIDSEEESFTGSISSLLGVGKNAECTFSRSDETGITSGRVYLAGDRMYGEFMASVDGKDFDAYVINDGEYSYTWSSATAQGTKLKISDVEATESAQNKNETSQTLEEDVDLKCKGWTVENSMFLPPSNIEFTDLISQFEQIQQNVPPQLENLESICDQLAGESKQQCLDALNGN